jgi:hypothetical protein
LRPGAAVGQPLDLGGKVAAVAGLPAGMGVQQAPADVGVERLAGYAEQGGSLGGGKIAAHGGPSKTDKLINLINIDD